MPTGFECYDTQGRLTLSLSDSITRIIGTVDTGLANGSISVPALTSGRPFFITTGLDSVKLDFYMPRVSVSGSTLTWTFVQATDNFRKACRIVYGVF